ncbi:MAG TPA: hypothetical protein VK787_02715 [Puia sp.]|jgi:hypothetical protein|nr:hypothetical protein [Puia sp.]
MKKLLFISMIAMSILSLSCVKYTSLPAYTPPVATNFSVSSLKHTADTVNLGDTIYLTATGTIYDTTKNIYAYLTVSSSASGVSTYTYGSASSPIKLSRTIGAQTNGLYAWTSTITLVGATTVNKAKLTITANFIYQLSFSSEQGKLTATDAGVANKTVYVN